MINVRRSIWSSRSSTSIPARSAVTTARGGSDVYATSTAGHAAGRFGQARALEHVTEQLVHLAAHAIEVREQIALGHLS